jgi:hypothetical protein
MEKEIFGFELDNRGLFKYQGRLQHLIEKLSAISKKPSNYEGRKE